MKIQAAFVQLKTADLGGVLVEQPDAGSLHLQRPCGGLGDTPQHGAQITAVVGPGVGQIRQRLALFAQTALTAAQGFFPRLGSRESAVPLPSIRRLLEFFGGTVKGPDPAWHRFVSPSPPLPCNRTPSSGSITASGVDLFFFDTIPASDFRREVWLNTIAGLFERRFSEKIPGDGPVVAETFNRSGASPVSERMRRPSHRWPGSIPPANSVSPAPPVQPFPPHKPVRIAGSVRASAP